MHAKSAICAILSGLFVGFATAPTFDLWQTVILMVGIDLAVISMRP